MPKAVILALLKQVASVDLPEILVEADECYLRYSYKGNHSKSKRFKMPRLARKRGGESVGKRGLSSEQVCIGTALDRTGNILIGMIGTGRAKYDNLKRFFEGRIAPHSILCTDKIGDSIRFRA